MIPVAGLYCSFITHTRDCAYPGPFVDYLYVYDASCHTPLDNLLPTVRLQFALPHADVIDRGFTLVVTRLLRPVLVPFGRCSVATRLGSHTFTACPVLTYGCVTHTAAPLRLFPGERFAHVLDCAILILDYRTRLLPFTQPDVLRPLPVICHSPHLLDLPGFHTPGLFPTAYWITIALPVVCPTTRLLGRLHLDCPVTPALLLHTAATTHDRTYLHVYAFAVRPLPAGPYDAPTYLPRSLFPTFTPPAYPRLRPIRFWAICCGLLDVIYLITGWMPVLCVVTVIANVVIWCYGATFAAT